MLISSLINKLGEFQTHVMLAYYYAALKQFPNFSDCFEDGLHYQRLL